jgi:hypothetical protein
MSKKKGRSAARRASKQNAAPLPVGSATPVESNGGHRAVIFLEPPTWNEETGELSWRGLIVLSLASHAHAERAALRAFQAKGWQWVVLAPFDQAAIGDATQEGRHAIHNLNDRQETKRIRFFSLQGRLIAWCDELWLTTAS